MTGATVRKWEATMARGDIGNWLETFRARAFPGMQAVDGFLGIRIFAQSDRDPCRVTVLTNWRDMDAVKRYAGDEPARTVMPDFMAPFFTDFDAEASFHDELLVEAKQ
jgi:Antibiotic biosynthesis monooxygenase